MLNGIVWQAMRPASDEYDVQKMQGATAAIEALRRAGGPGPSSDAGTARAQDTLEFATAMIMLIKPVDDYPIAEQCRQIREARNMPAGTPRGNIGMLLAMPPWTEIINTYLTAMLKEKEHEFAKTALVESLSTASSDAAAGVVTNAVTKIREWREAATREEWRRPLADAILTRARAVLESVPHMNSAQLRATDAMLQAILGEAAADGASPESAKSRDEECGPQLRECIQKKRQSRRRWLRVRRWWPI